MEPFRPLRLSTLHLVQNRSHVRGIVVDGRVAWTGGFGIDDLQAAFAAARVEATGVLFTGRVTLAAHEDGVAAAGLLNASPTLGSTAPDRSFVELLVDAAGRGVDVRILTAGAATDVRTVRLAGRAWYETLLAAGVRVYEWQPSTMHARTFVVDGVWVTIGSMNFDNRSLALNDEATLMILDRLVGQQMERIFVDDLSHAEEITLARFRERFVVSTRSRECGTPADTISLTKACAHWLWASGFGPKAQKPSPKAHYGRSAVSAFASASSPVIFLTYRCVSGKGGIALYLATAVGPAL